MTNKKTEYNKIRYEKKSIVTVILLIVSFFLPLILNYIILFINGYALSLKNLLLFTNDEVYWHAQTAGAVKYGMPCGYFGYNGSFAEIGTYNTWGPFPFIPYIIMGRIFGFNIYSRHIFNIVFMGIGIVVVQLLIKADIKKILILDIVLCLMPLNDAYLLTAMSEPERFFLALILAGMFVRLSCYETGNIFRYLILPLTIVISCFIYYLYLVFIPLYIFWILKDKKWYQKTVAAAGAGLATAIPIFYLNGKMSAPYNIRSGLSQTVDLIVSYLDLSNGILYSLKGIFYAFWQNLAHFGPKNLVNIFFMEKGFYSVYIAVYELSVLLLTVSVFISRKKKNTFSKILNILYVTAIFLMAFALLYAEEPLTVARGLNCAVIFAAVFYIGSDLYKEMKPFYTVVFIVFILMVLGFGMGFVNGFCESGYEAAKKTEYITAERSVIQQCMQLEPGASPWKNTIGYYGELGTEYLEIPDGFGINYMTEYGIDDKMGWVVINKKGTKDLEELRAMVGEFYADIYENDDFYILQNKENSETSK